MSGLEDIYGAFQKIEEECALAWETLAFGTWETLSSTLPSLKAHTTGLQMHGIRNVYRDFEAANDIEWQLSTPEKAEKIEDAQSPKVFKTLETLSFPLDPGDSDDEFRSVSSYVSKTTFHTATSRLDGKSSCSMDLRLQRDSDYAQALAKQNLWPVDPSFEQDWPGRGQHADFQKEERNLINNILVFQEPLGRGSYATVDSVKCRRILLARKTIFCRRPLNRMKAIEEVAHLTRLKHSHIVRVIGTYTVSKELSILMYPVADHNLDDFLLQLFEEQQQYLRPFMLKSTLKFFGCLISAIHAIHMRLIKHMDIKPQNILVRRQDDYSISSHVGNSTYHIYITDFGISRSYKRLEDANTDGPTSFTRKYAAPEVVEGNTRGFPADIFSLGCVFLEMAACIYDCIPDLEPQQDAEGSAQNHLQGLLWASTPRRPWYYANIDRIDQHISSSEWPGYLERSVLPQETFSLIRSMIADDPEARPEAETLCAHFTPQECCGQEPLPLEATK
ncbi:hypothetical protein PTT_18737 [Pyrenophora teres f. teres 0-1]|uniref:Protein kinase domain-containing protein n=1 Tax=Pyrenophora teres f. teres (strain 0-1) TaxID=861557 RepID=E3S7E4_PYRTT|nr:hypothetical protein PTT_18737 [Pyrenophora teres f. teres 0-1]